MSVTILNENAGSVNNQNRINSGHIIAGLALLLAPLAVLLSTMGNPLDYFQYDLPPGQALYTISKLIGLYAVTFLWLQVMYGLIRHDQKFGSLLPAWSMPSHRLLGLLVLTSAMLHFGAFLTAASIRKKEIMTHLLVPDFTHGFYTAVVSLGWVALVVMLIVVAAGLLRQSLGRYWIWAHRLSLVVLTLVLLHSTLIGSETRTVTWIIFYVFASASLLIAFIRRLRARAVY